MKKKIQSESTKIKNYTSAMPVDRTLMLIEKELLKIGVNGFEKKYINGIISAVIFSVEIDSKKLCFKLPANIQEAENILTKIPEYHTKSKEWLKQQAYRTAWKLIYDWICIQVAMVQLKQVDAVQIFLSYMYNKQTEQTVYDNLRMNNFKLLE